MSDELLQIIPVNTPEQILEITELACETWIEHFEPLIGYDRASCMEQKFQRREVIEAQIFAGYRYYFLSLNGEKVGYAVVKQDGDTLFLDTIYVRKRNRNRGVAKAAVTFFIYLCKQENLRRIWLSVDRNNTSVISACERIGFSIENQGKNVDEYGDFFDDYVMHLNVV